MTRNICAACGQSGDFETLLDAKAKAIQLLTASQSFVVLTLTEGICDSVAAGNDSDIAGMVIKFVRVSPCLAGYGHDEAP